MFHKCSNHFTTKLNICLFKFFRCGNFVHRSTRISLNLKSSLFLQMFSVEIVVKERDTSTSLRLLSELRQRSVAPKQKQLVQPLGLVGSKWNVPSRHWSHREPCTFSYRWRTASRLDNTVECRQTLVRVIGLAHLAQTLSCEGVAHFLFSSCLVAIAWPAVGVTIETRGAAVALTANDVVLTSGRK